MGVGLLGWGGFVSVLVVYGFSWEELYDIYDRFIRFIRVIASNILMQYRSRHKCYRMAKHLARVFLDLRQRNFLEITVEAIQHAVAQPTENSNQVEQA